MTDFLTKSAYKSQWTTELESDFLENYRNAKYKQKRKNTKKDDETLLDFSYRSNTAKR